MRRRWAGCSAWTGPRWPAAPRRKRTGRCRRSRRSWSRRLGNGAAIVLAMSRAPTGPAPSREASIIDPDVRVMRSQKGYVAGYNGQAMVTADQVIVGAMLSQHPVDRTLLHPLLDTCRQQLAVAGFRPKLRTVLADSGYVSEDNFARADTDGLRLLAPLAKDPGRHYA